GVAGTATGPVRSAAALAKRVDGIDYDAVPAGVEAVEPGDRRYAEVRSTYMRRGAPGLVLRPSTTAEVASALTYARGQRGPLAVRSGGHGISGRSTNDGGVVLDLERLSSVEVLDESARRVRIGAGATWGAVASAIARRGWAISSGDYGGVGVGGLATTGGIGLLGRLHGLTIDHVLAYEVVLADGSVHVVSASAEPDLFWGLRGAGGNLGVVTAVEIEASEVPDVVFAQMVFDATDPAALVSRWGALVQDAPRELTSFLHLSAGGRDRGPMAQAMTVWASSDTAAAVEVLEPMLDVAPVLQQRAQVTPYAGIIGPVSKHHDGGAPPVSRSGLLPRMTDAAGAALGDLLLSGEASLLQLRATGGAVHDVDASATAYAHRSQEFSVTSFAGRLDRSGLDDAWDRLAYPHMDGLYLSFETDPRPERLLDAFPPATLDRLRALKRTYDPDHAFDQNFPIDPAG
ncbi:FAD-binding oxidoreductase, partial [Cellulomonas septica]